VGVADDATVAHDGVAHVGAIHLATRQKAHVRENGGRHVKERERRQRIGEGEVRIEEGTNRSDVLPIALVDVGADLTLFDRLRDDVLPEVHVIVIQRSAERLTAEHVNAHGGLKEFGILRLAEFLQERWRNVKFIEKLRILGLFLEADHVPVGIGVHDAKRWGVLARNGDGCERDVRLGLDMLLEHFAEIHPIQLIRR
jgi:hypothetical protein